MIRLGSRGAFCVIGPEGKHERRKSWNYYKIYSEDAQSFQNTEQSLELHERAIRWSGEEAELSGVGCCGGGIRRASVQSNTRRLLGRHAWFHDLFGIKIASLLWFDGWIKKQGESTQDIEVSSHIVEHLLKLRISQLYFLTTMLLIWFFNYDYISSLFFFVAAQW